MPAGAFSAAKTAPPGILPQPKWQLCGSGVREAGIEAPLQIEGSRVVPIVRGSTKGGDLAFIFNFERSEAKVTVRPKQAPSAVRDLLVQSDLPLDGGTFQLTIPPWKHAVVHLA